MHKVFYLALFQLLGSRSMGCSSVPTIFPWWQLHILPPTRKNVLIHLSHLLCQLVACTIAISDSMWELPTFDEICKLQCRTLNHIPATARPAFSAVLSSALRSVLYDNTEESWIKLFMLHKCILSSSKRRGRHHKHTFVKYLCELWSNEVLWQHAIGQASSKPFPLCNDFQCCVMTSNAATCPYSGRGYSPS